MTHCKRYTPAIALSLATLFIVGCLTPQAGHDPALTKRLDSTLTRLSSTGATVSARVVTLPERRELYARDSDVPFTPASNMKLPNSATGLAMFGPDHTFKTYLALDGNDLWVIGTGDPGIGDPRLARRHSTTPTAVFDAWADLLAQRGLTQIPGNLYYYDGALDNEWIHPSWGDDALHWYGAPTSGLNFHDNCIDITIYPTEPGQPVRYEVAPPVQQITVINECSTSPRNDSKIEKLPDGNIYKISGTCSEKTELKSKPLDNPGAFLCDALRTHLATRGITIAGPTKQAASPLGGTIPPPADRLIATHETSVRDIIDRINTNSQNFFAEALCKLTGQAYAARGRRAVPGSWADGERAIRAFLRGNGIDDRHYVVADGSGLSDINKVTSRLLTDLLALMFSRPDGDIYRDSLAKGGVNGTLEKRFAGLRGHVFAKTGSINGVRTLSGYVKTYGDEWLTFSILYNNLPADPEPHIALIDEAVRLLVYWPNLPEQLPATTQPARERRPASAPVGVR